MAVKRKRLRLIFLLRAGFLTLVVIIITVGLFSSATMRDGARNVQQVVEDQKLLAKNMIASKEKWVRLS